MQITIAGIEYAEQAEDVAAMFTVLAQRRQSREHGSGTWHPVDDPHGPAGTNDANEDIHEGLTDAVAEPPKARRGRKPGSTNKGPSKAEVKANTEALAADGPSDTDTPIAMALDENVDLSSMLEDADITEAEPEAVEAAEPEAAAEPAVAEDADGADWLSDMLGNDNEAEEEPVSKNPYDSLSGKPLYDAMRVLAGKLGGSGFTKLLNSYGIKNFKDVNEEVARRIMFEHDQAQLKKAA